MTYRNVNKTMLVQHLASKLDQPTELLDSLLSEYLAQKPKRTRQAPPDHLRCMARVWRDGDGQQCMSKRTCGDFCSRHAKPVTKPCKYCSKGDKVVFHQFAWEHHGRIDDLNSPSHFLSVDCQKAQMLDTPIVCKCGQEIAFKRTECPSCQEPIVV